MIGRGVNQGKPEMELEGRRLLAVARIENEILLGAKFLAKNDLRRLASILFGTSADDADIDPDDYTTDAVETNAEALNKRAVDTADLPLTAFDVPDDARDVAPPLAPTRKERLRAMFEGSKREQARYPKPELLSDPDDVDSEDIDLDEL